MGRSVTKQDWPERDQRWLFEYLLAVTQPEVSQEVVERRLAELRAALEEAGEPAETIFGDARTLGRADAAELGTVEEAIRTEGGSGARSTVTHIGALLTVMGVITAVILLFAAGWTIDITLRTLGVIVGIFAAGLGLALARVLLVSGRAIACAVAALVGIAVMVGSVAVGFHFADAAPLLRGIPTLLVGFVAVVPGLALLGIARMLPQTPATERWDEKRWMRRFTGALRARGMSGSGIRDRERELRAAIADAGDVDDYGDPVVLARIIAADEPNAIRRRWLLTTIGLVGFPLLISFAQFAGMAEDGWSWWSAVIALIALAFGGFMAFGQWSERPGKAPA